MATDADVQRVQNEARTLVRNQALARSRNIALSGRRVSDFVRVNRVEGIAGGAGASLQITGNELVLVVASLTPARITNISVSGTTLSLAATNGAANGSWTLLQSTNVALPFSQWQTNRIGTYDGSGNLSTNIVSGVTGDQMYFMLK
jgi:hypothetical protein